MSGSGRASATKVAQQVLAREAAALQQAAERMQNDPSGFEVALDLALERVSRGGKVVLVGVGKSGACPLTGYNRPEDLVYAHVHGYLERINAPV